MTFITKGKVFGSALGAAAVLAFAPAHADEVRDQVNLALELYDEGDFAGAATELQFAISAIQAKQGELYAETFPPAPEGWTAGEVESEGAAGMMGGGTMLSRAYTSDGGASMDVQLMLDNPMIQGMAAMFANPAIVASQPNMERVRVGRDNAFLDTDSGELTMLVGGRGMIQISGNGLDDNQQLVDLLQSWDFERLRELAGM